MTTDINCLSFILPLPGQFREYLASHGMLTYDFMYVVFFSYLSAAKWHWGWNISPIAGLFTKTWRLGTAWSVRNGR